jgi:hypothetical protein
MRVALEHGLRREPRQAGRAAVHVHMLADVAHLPVFEHDAIGLDGAHAAHSHDASDPAQLLQLQPGLTMAQRNIVGCTERSMRCSSAWLSRRSKTGPAATFGVACGLEFGGCRCQHARRERRRRLHVGAIEQPEPRAGGSR